MDDEKKKLSLPDYYLIILLAICGWREASGEGLLGIRAVLHVIRNRHLAWKQDWDTVISNRNQFSSMTTPGDSQLLRWPDDDSPLFRQILDEAEKVFSGSEPDTTNGATYYRNPKTANSPWFKKHVAEVMPKVAVIGNHEFFAPEKHWNQVDGIDI